MAGSNDVVRSSLAERRPSLLWWMGCLVLGVGSAPFLESLDFGAVNKVTILLATTIALILSFVWMWAEGVPNDGYEACGIAFGDQYCRC